VRRKVYDCTYIEPSHSVRGLFYSLYSILNPYSMYYNDDTVIYFDGNFMKASEAGTDLYGQSLHYGYSVFEGIKSYSTDHGTRIFKAKEHYERLKRSAELMHIPFDYSVEQLTALTYELLEKTVFRCLYPPISHLFTQYVPFKRKKSYLS
jgi:branched-chain amino acid aminotransferase